MGDSPKPVSGYACSRMASNIRTRKGPFVYAAQRCSSPSVFKSHLIRTKTVIGKKGLDTDARLWKPRITLSLCWRHTVRLMCSPM